MGASTTITYTVSLDDDGKYAFTKGENAEEDSAISQMDLLLKEGITYKFDCSDVASIPLFSITEDGSHTDTDGMGTMGEQSVEGISFYVDDVLLEDIEMGDDMTTQFKAALAGGMFTSLYFKIDPSSLEKSTMYYYDSDTESLGGSCSLALAGVGSVPDVESYRQAGGEHHKAPPSVRLAGKKAVRSAALQGIEQSKISSSTTTGVQRGSNNSGHPPISSGGQVGGGSKGHSN